MSHQGLVSIGALVVVIGVVGLAPVLVAGQAPTGVGDPWTPPRTPWGDPDIQGMWNTQTATPLERPGAFGEREFLSETDVAVLNEKAAESRDDTPPREGDPGTYNQFWSDAGVTVVKSRRTSLIINPPDGRLPWKPEARDLIARGEREAPTSAADVDTGERCLTDGPTMVPSQSYNMNFHILKSPGYVVIRHEMFSNRHIIPLDGRPHLPGNIGQWLGDSRGRWEGNTLIVETKNFADKAHYRWSSPWRASRTALHLVERFTLIDAETLQYQFTIMDPTMFTRPWTGEIPMRKTADRQFEYACHEGNYAMPNILCGARARERAAAEAGTSRR